MSPKIDPYSTKMHSRINLLLLLLTIIIFALVLRSSAHGQTFRLAERISSEWAGDDRVDRTDWLNIRGENFGRFSFDDRDLALEIVGHPGNSHLMLSDRPGDVIDSASAQNARINPAGDFVHFPVSLSNNVFVPAGASSPETSDASIPDTTGGPGVFYLGSGGNWDAVGAWGPDPNTYPNAQSAIATDLQVVSGAIVQNVAAGVALGIIDHNPTTAGNSGLSVSWTITTANQIVLNNGLSPAQINNSQAVGNNSLTINGSAGLYVNSNLNITNANATGLITISAPIAGDINITTGGIGTTLLTGDNSFFYGSTIVNQGTLNAGAQHALGGVLGHGSVTVNSGGTLLFSGNTTDRIRDLAPINLNGGTLNTGGLSEGAPSVPGMGALTLTSASTIDLANGASIIAFANSKGVWGGALRILNWSGNLGGDGTDQVYFGSNASGLNATQLDQISFYSDNGVAFLGTARILTDGEVVPVPEASTWAAAGLAVAAVAFSQRRRLSGLLRTVAV